MSRKRVRKIVWEDFVLVAVLSAAWPVQAQEAKTPYPSMAAPEQYLIADRNDEIALARSAAPDSISKDAEVLVLGRKGYESAVKGKNGFVCIVERSWTAEAENPDFWNPKLRAPICLNPQAARSYLPITVKKTELVLAGASKQQMVDGIQSSFEKKELTTPELGSMCYMMSSHQYLNSVAGRWHPHLMFFLPPTEGTAWGAGLPGSPVIVSQDAADHLTVFMILLAKWSDGTTAPPMDENQ